jgi:cytochrome c-type biogenesis protein CcsB
MSTLSDQLLVVAIMGYLVAMLCAAAEYAFGGRSGVARAAGQPVRELVGAGGAVSGAGVSDPGGAVSGAGGGASAGAPAPSPAGPAGAAGPAGPARLAGPAATVAFLVAVAAHLGCVAARGLAAHRMTWGNMYEFVLSVTLVGALAWLLVLWRRPALRHLTLYVALALVTLLGLAGMVLYTAVSPLVPALNSYWFLIHVSSVIVASGVFLIGFVAAALYLVRAGYEAGRRRFPYSLGRRLPAAQVLELLAFRLHAFAFPIWTFGVVAGAIWAEAAWGRYWGWDPKETWAFISWVVYAGYLHARATPSVRRTATAWIAVAGWLTMMMNLFGVNIFFVGFHSYGGL